MNWSKLSMADRARYIKLAIQSGITDLNSIHDVYNTYAKGGHIYDGSTEATQQMNIDEEGHKLAILLQH